MTQKSSTRTEWIVAMVSVLAATCIVAVNVAGIRRSAAVISDYEDNFRRLRDEQSVSQRQSAAVEAYSELGDVRAVPLSDLFERTVPGTKYDTREIPGQAVLPGWALRRNSVSFPRCDLRKLGNFLNAAEAQRPPWRVTECTITALTPDGSVGHARVFLQTLERKN